MSKVGFIGLGNMGGPMARNLVKAGYEVKGFDLSADAMAALVEVGGTGAASAGEAAKDVDFVITMLPAGPHVRGVYTGDDGFWPTRPRAPCSSTVRPSTSTPRARLQRLPPMPVS